jgi:hypothetical protein
VSAASQPRVPTRCPACGRPFHLSAAAPRPPALCPDCGSATDLPPDRGGPEPAADRYLLAEGTTADDGRAYGVFGERPVPPCPACGKPLPDDAPACGHCNWHRDVGKRLPRTYKPIERVWEAGWSFRWRFAAFLACQVLNVLTAIMVYLERQSLPASVGEWVMMSALQAFVLGTYDRVNLHRNANGKVTLTKTWRACFVPLTPKVIRWREHEGVVVRHSDVGIFDWLICLSLLMGGVGPCLFYLTIDHLYAILFLLSGVVLGAVFWWFAIRPGRVMVALTQNLGDPVSVLYAGTDVGRATEIAEAVRDVAGLPYDALG